MFWGPWLTEHQRDETLEPNQGHDWSRGCFWETHYCGSSWSPLFSHLDLIPSVWKLQWPDRENPSLAMQPSGQNAPTQYPPFWPFLSLGHVSGIMVGLSLSCSYAHMGGVCVCVLLVGRSSPRGGSQEHHKGSVCGKLWHWNSYPQWPLLCSNSPHTVGRPLPPL